MIPKDIINLTVKNITYRKVRSWLTILGVIIGIAAVVGLVGLGDAIDASIKIQLGGLGADKLIISPGKSQQVFSRGTDMQGPPTTTINSNLEGAKPLTESEAQEISRLPNIKAAMPMVQKQYMIQYRSEYSLITTQFVEPTSAQIVEMPEMLEGRWLSPNDKTSCVIGYDIAKNTYTNEIRTGDQLRINETVCRVVGILKKQGGFTGQDNYVILNIETIEKYSPEYNNELTYINVKVQDTSKIEETEETIKKLIMKLHNTLEEDFTILSFASIQESVNSITTLITAFLGGIAAISLLVGAIGISNTMLTSVMERTREIGILKAIGAKKKDILTLFLTESSIMSLIGGIIGVICGIGLSQAIITLMPILFDMPTQASENLKLVIKTELVIGALIISVIIGAVSGYTPARKAAGLNPIQAIWYE